MGLGVFLSRLSAIACAIVCSPDLLPNSYWDNTRSSTFSFAYALISVGKKPELEARRNQGTLQ